MNVCKIISVQAQRYASGYRISAKTYKPPYLEENMTGESLLVCGCVSCSQWSASSIIFYFALLV